MIDWKSKAKELGKGGDYWKPKREGRYKITFLDNGEEYTFEWEGEKRNKVRFKVDVSDGQKAEMCLLSVTQSYRSTSFFGQLARVAAQNKGLEGSTLNITVIGMGKERKYVVDEALNLDNSVENEPIMSK